MEANRRRTHVRTRLSQNVDKWREPVHGVDLTEFDVTIIFPVAIVGREIKNVAGRTVLKR